MVMIHCPFLSQTIETGFRKTFAALLKMKKGTKPKLYCMEVKLSTAEAMAMKCDTPLLYLLFIYSLVLLCAYVGSNILFTATYTYFGALIINQTQLVALMLCT